MPYDTQTKEIMLTTLAKKYFILLPVVLLTVNIAGFTTALFGVKIENEVHLPPVLTRHWVELVGIFFCVPILFDRKRIIGASSFLIGGILVMTLLDYFIGIVLFIMYLLILSYSNSSKGSLE